MTPWPPPLTLSHGSARLEPLSTHHAPALRQAAADGALHKLWYTLVPSPEAMETEIERRLAEQAAGRMLPFCVIGGPALQPVGMTSYMNPDRTNRRLEIGSTWYAASMQRTGLNTQGKRLLLGHAFEMLECIAVEFRTHVMNRQSRAAIERLGARLDGILRNHQIMPNGTLRDTAVYSVTCHEWPAVRANLDWHLQRAQG